MTRGREWTQGRREGEVRGGDFGAFRRFKLSDVDGLVWLPDPDDPGVVLNSGEVRTLPDATDPAEDVEQTTAANQPAFVESDSAANGRSTVHYISSNGDFLTAGDNHDLGTKSLSLFAPLRIGADVLGQVVRKRGTGAGGAESGWFLQYTGDNASSKSVFRAYVEDDSGNGLALNGTASSSLIDSSMHLIEMHFNASSGKIEVVADRTVLGSSTSDVVGNINGASHLCLGCAWDGASAQSSFFNGWLGKISMYLRDASIGPVSGAQLTAVRDFYSSIYGTP